MSVTKSKIKTITEDGEWKDWFKWATELENGVKGTMYTKTNEMPAQPNQEIDYTINGSGTIKMVDPDNLPVSDQDRQLMICRQSSIKAAIDHNRGGLLSWLTGGPSMETILKDSDTFTHYIYNGLNKKK